MNIGIDGNIYDSNNKKVGSYGYSFCSCRFSWEVDGFIHHFYKKQELVDELERLGYHV